MAQRTPPIPRFPGAHSPLSTDRLKRREFLRWNLVGGLWLAAGPVRALAAEPATPDIAVATGKPGPSARAAVELLGGMGRFVAKGQKVVIKPNMSFAHPPENATTTHPETVAAVVAMCQEAGASQVLVLDHPLRGAELCLERTGIAAVCEPLGAGAHGLASSSQYVEAEIPDGREMRVTDVMRAVMEADVLIAVPQAKSHGSTGVSLSLKGMMGLIWNRGVMHSRYDLDGSIVDLNTLLRADLAVVDATRVLTTNGPYGPGKVETRNMVVASADPVAADAATVERCTWYGRRVAADKVGHLRIAHERGLGRIDVANLTTAEVAV